MSYTQIKNYQPYLYIGKYKLKPKCKLSIGSGIKLERQKKKKNTPKHKDTNHGKNCSIFMWNE